MSLKSQPIKSKTMVTFKSAAITLFGYHGSSTTNRIRIAMAVKGIPYDYVSIDEGAANVQRSDEWTSTKNKLAQIPVLQVTDSSNNNTTLLRQSVAIMEFLEEAYPNTKSLLPKDPIERAKTREIVEIVNSFIQPMQNKLTVEKIAEMEPKLAAWLPLAVKAHIDGGTHAMEEGEETPILWPHEWIIKGFNAIESLIDDEDTSKFCFGNEVTLADCAVTPQVIGAKKYLVDMTKYPKLLRVHDNVLALEEVQKTMKDVIDRL